MSLIIPSLYGFMGQTSDFDLLGSYLPKSIELDSIDYRKNELFQNVEDFNLWSDIFNKLCLKNEVAMGYSQGGRLLANSFFKASSRLKKAIFISSQPGIQDSERSLRRLFDQKWIDRFLSNEDWEMILRDWNSLEVFKGSKSEPQRLESDFSRISLAKELQYFSVANQENLWPKFLGEGRSILFVTGEYDIKYTQIGSKLAQLNPKIKHICLEGAGHRVHIDQPKKLAEVICEFVL